MMRESFNQGFITPGYPPQPFMGNYWGSYPPQPMPHYHQQMSSYPVQVAGDSVMQPYQGGGFQPKSYSVQPMTIGNFQGPAMYQPMSQASQSFNPFDNPLQPQVKRPPQLQFANPYPKQQFMQKPQPSGFQSVLNQFKTQDGSVDITKMMNTAGQAMNTFSQMTSLFKGVGSLFKIT